MKKNLLCENMEVAETFLNGMNMFPAHTQFLLYFLLTKYGNKFMHGSPVNKPNKN